MKFLKENIRLVVAIVIAIILILTGVILINTKDDNESTTPTVEEKTKEEQLVNATGMTGEDAIKIVKDNFGSDNYTFEAEATNDGLYKVVVTNIVDNKEIIYFVDPTNGMAYIDMDTK